MTTLKNMTHDECLAEIATLRLEDDRLMFERIIVSEQHAALRKHAKNATRDAERIGRAGDPDRFDQASFNARSYTQLADDAGFDIRRIDERRQQIDRRIDKLRRRIVDIHRPFTPSFSPPGEPTPRTPGRPLEDLDATGIPGVTS